MVRRLTGAMAVPDLACGIEQDDADVGAVAGEVRHEALGSRQ